MKKVFQTVVDKGFGNCMQAATASVLNLEMHEVPNFIEYLDCKDTGPHFELMKFVNGLGYDYTIWTSSYRNGKEKLVLRNSIAETKAVLDADGGVDGYFYASVQSRTFDDVSHAVVIDKDMNIVHDPNPNQLALNLTEMDILDIMTMSDKWYINTDGTLVLNYE